MKRFWNYLFIISSILSIITILIVIVFLFILPFSCSGKKNKEEQTIHLPPTPVFSTGSRWGVVAGNYVRLRVNPSKEAEVLEGLTRGTMLEILFPVKTKESPEDETVVWYRVSLDGQKAWVCGSYLEVLDSWEKADKLSKEYK